MEEPETEEEPIPETEEEPEENFTRSGGRRASNLGRNREVASKQISTGNKLAETKKLDERNKSSDTNKVYQYEVGILLDEDDDEYDSYNEVWDKQHGFYNEDWGVELDLESAKEYVQSYVNDGVVNTYAIISEIIVSDEELEDIKENIDENGYVETSDFDMDYSIDNVIYSLYKSNNGIVENFLNKSLEESKLQESINIDKFLLDVDDVEHETMSAIGTDEGVENHYADGYKAGMDMIRLIADEDRQFPDDLINDLEKKQSEAYTDYESMEDEEAKRLGIDDDYVEGWYQAFEDILNMLGAGTITPDKKEESKLTEAPTEEDEEFKKLCAEIEFQADENDFTLTKEDVKGIAKKMIADKFFFNHDIFADENDEEAWGEINDLIVSAIEAYPNKVEESKLVEDEDLSYTDSDTNNCKVYYAVNTSGYKSLGLIVNDKDKKFQVVAGQKLRSGSKTAKKSKKQIWDMAKELKDNGYEEVRGPSSVAGEVDESKEIKEEAKGFITVGNKKYGVNTALNMINTIYDILYDSEDELDNIFPFGIGTYTDKGDKLIKEQDPQVVKLINARGDAFTSDREATALGMFFSGLTNEALTAMLISNASKTESKEVKTEKKIVIDNMGETYTIDTDAKTYTVKTANGEKTFTFDEMNEFVKQARGANRLYKPYSLLAYTDYKNGNLKNWEIRQDLDDDLVYKPLEKKLNDIVQNELNGDPKYTVDTFDILNSDGSIGKGIGIVTEYNGTKYGIKANANDWTLTHLGTGTRVKTFDTYQKAIDSIPEMDKSIKAMPDRVEELTKKFNDAKGIKTEGVDKSKVQDKANVVCTLNLKGEDKLVSGGFDKVDINIQGVNTLTTNIKNAITKNFGGIFRSELTDKVYSQDIPVTDNLWLTFLDFDENTNTLNFVLDGDVSEDKELVESKKEESVPQKEYDDILLAIDQADSVEELQDIIYAVTDGTVEDEMQSMYDTCIKDKDDLDTIKNLLTAIFEDNTEIEE